VQNHYNVTHRVSEPVLAACSARGIGFIAYFPFAAGALAREGSELDRIAAEAGATPAQVALRWLLDKDPVMLPIPGTSTVAHLDENCAAAGVQLSDAQRGALDALARPA
jgi:aryl-alcohol dehydrogenase-like predicted oxidoreductase